MRVPLESSVDMDSLVDSLMAVFKMISDSRLTLLGQLIEVTERQIDAARTLRHGDLDALNLTHSDLLFQLTVAMQEPLPEDPVALAAIREKAHELGRSQERLATLAGSGGLDFRAGQSHGGLVHQSVRQSGRLRAV